ncbi:hypothetical protein KKF34_04340 [Myxococcota bacterium]|nr:hypothetical protein [Myxococcota bacterium]MBU1379311.1 hypothetical protein [Myxococcota bacterium]MBU1496087.1 hypothetical protein [Myxococcota bacterium]
MGFFSKIFGGKKDQDDQEKSGEETPSKEIKTEKPREKSSEKQAIKEEDKSSPVKEPKKEEKSVSGEMPSRRDSAVSGEMAVSSKSEREEDRSETVESQALQFETLNEQPSSKPVEEPQDEKPEVQFEEEEGAEDVEPAEEEPELEEEPQAEFIPATKSQPDFDDDNLFGGSKPAAHKPESTVSQSLSNTIACSTCSRKLPIPFVGYNAKITCPFCLTVNEYKA